MGFFALSALAAPTLAPFLFMRAEGTIHSNHPIWSLAAPVDELNGFGAQGCRHLGKLSAEHPALCRNYLTWVPLPLWSVRTNCRVLTRTAWASWSSITSDRMPCTSSSTVRAMTLKPCAVIPFVSTPKRFRAALIMLSDMHWASLRALGNTQRVWPVRAAIHARFSSPDVPTGQCDPDWFWGWYNAIHWLPNQYCAHSIVRTPPSKLPPETAGCKGIFPDAMGVKKPANLGLMRV